MSVERPETPVCSFAGMEMQPAICGRPAEYGAVLYYGPWMLPCWVCEEHKSTLTTLPQLLMLTGPLRWSGQLITIEQYQAGGKMRTRPYCEICGEGHWTMNHTGGGSV